MWSQARMRAESYIAALSVRQRWTLAEVNASGAVAQVTREKAAAIADDAAVRAGLEGLLDALYGEAGVRGLLMFVTGARGEIVGYAELELLTSGDFEWRGPYLGSPASR